MIFFCAQIIENLPQVEACAVSLSERDRLLAFIVLTSGQPGALSSSEFTHQKPFQHSTQSSEDLTTVGVSRNSTSPSLRVIEGEIRQRLSQLLASHSIPDMIFFIPALPLTSHGKWAPSSEVHTKNHNCNDNYIRDCCYSCGVNSAILIN